MAPKLLPGEYRRRALVRDWIDQNRELLNGVIQSITEVESNDNGN